MAALLPSSPTPTPTAPLSSLTCALLFGCLGAGLLTPAAAQEASSGDANGDTSGDIAWLEKSRSATYGLGLGIARTVDSWFGDAPFEASGGTVSGYLRLGYLWKQADGSDLNVRFRLKAHLPNAKDKAYVFIGRDNQREEVKDQPDSFTSEQLLQREDRHQDHSFFAGLGYGLADGVDLRLGVHGGWKLYGQARYRKQWALSERNTLFFRESLFWSIHDHLGSTTALDFERQLSPRLLLRWSNAGTITQRSSTFEWQSSLGLHQSYSNQRLASIELLAEGRTNRSDVSDYGVRASWSQPVYKDWLIGKFTLGHFWPKEEQEQRRRSWAVGASVDMHF